MAKIKKIKSKIAKVKWPDESVIAEIRERLSSDKVIGSTVLGPDASLADRIRYELCSKIVQFHLVNKISQKALAKKLAIDEPEMSRLLHYKTERYSIERLLGYVEILYPHLEINILAA